MHVLSFPCKLHFAILWACSSSCTWWGLICSCLITNMAAFSFWNWAQVTDIKMVFRQGKPKSRPCSCNVVKNCEKVIERAEFCHKIKSFRDASETNSTLKQCGCRNVIFVQNSCAKFHLVFHHFHLINNSIMLCLNLYFEVSATWMEYILINSLSRCFKNTATFKFSHNALDIAWVATNCHEAINNIWQKRSGLMKWEMRVLY